MSTIKVDTVTTLDGTGNITLSRPLTGLSGSGASLTALNATQLTSGTIPDARFPSTLPAASGASLTALNATQLTSGTIPMARLSGTLPALNGSALTNLPAHSGNVAFPASQSASANANTLDDYEEGSWTPGFQTGTPTYTTTYARSGVYTKIGRHVFVSFSIYMGNVSFSDATTRMEIGPLPFTCSSSVPHSGFGGTADSFNLSGWSGGTYNNGSLGAKSINAQIEGNSTVIKIRVCDETSSQYYLRNAAIVGDGMIRATVWYMV